jgi:hypothetical protein
MASQDQITNAQEPPDDSARQLSRRLLEETRQARDEVLRQLAELREHERQERFERPSQ